ncbi:MAG: HAD-IIIA family hydrolase [Kiritimatiellaeota bacterium]|nr:HAD-IIIA family hydrolase [Kiritimatiellota bacterium]
MQPLTPCVFFDRDGIVNVSPSETVRYIERPEDFEIVPEFLAALRIVNERGYAAVIATNQKGVAIGRVREEALMAMHRKLITTVLQHGLRLLDIRVSITADNAHPSRKPNPGMLLGAAEEHGLDLKRSWMIGDHDYDIEAGRRAGCRTVFVGQHDMPGADFVVPDMAALVKFLDAQLEKV